MLEYVINKTFANQEECNKWEDENIPNNTYNGHPVVMVGHSCTLGENSVTLTKIYCF